MPLTWKESRTSHFYHCICSTIILLDRPLLFYTVLHFRNAVTLAYGKWCTKKWSQKNVGQGFTFYPWPSIKAFALCTDHHPKICGVQISSASSLVKAPRPTHGPSPRNAGVEFRLFGPWLKHLASFMDHVCDIPGSDLAFGHNGSIYLNSAQFRVAPILVSKRRSDLLSTRDHRMTLCRHSNQISNHLIS